MKSDRRRDLLRILHQGHASTQQEFVAALRDAGHDVTQATVSRDLHELGAIKIRIGDEVAYRFPDELRSAATPGSDRTLLRELTDFAIDVRAAGSLVIVITLPGHAGAIARAIDLSNTPEVLGTIAGDDTVFAATADAGTAQAIAASWLHRGSARQEGSR